MRVGLLSDTHGFFDSKISDYFSSCDEIWHAGDIGTLDVAEELEALKPFRAVYGNIDGQDIRVRYPENQRFTIEGLDIWITHIGGYPGRYDRMIKDDIQRNPPDLFVCGHSHILKVIRDPKLDLIHMNPGAAGKHGFHKVKTMLRFEINNAKIEKVEVIELGNRATLDH